MAKITQHIEIIGDVAHVVERRIVRSVPAAEMAENALKQIPRTSPMLPPGCRMMHEWRDQSVFVIEQAPQIRKLVWRDMDTPEKNEWELSFPFVVFIVKCVKNTVSEGMVFYRTKPLSNTYDTLYRSNLCNVYKEGTICTGDMRCSGNTAAAKAGSFVTEFWKSEFNSDLQEKCFEPMAQKVKQLNRLSTWEKASTEDPDFILKVVWDSVGPLKNQF